MTSYFIDNDIQLLNEIHRIQLQSELQKISTKTALAFHKDTTLIKEGVFIETGKVIIGDLIKDLISIGAVAITGGAGGDTIVDVLYALERTKQVTEAYNAIMSSKDITVDFLNSIESMKLVNNPNQIKNKVTQTISLLSQQYDKIAGKGSVSEALNTVVEYAKELKEKLKELLKKIAKSVSTWISAMIPDDGGTVGTAINTALVFVFETADSMVDTPFQTFVNTIPDKISNIAFDEDNLKIYLDDMCNKIADAVEEHGMGLIGKIGSGILSANASSYSMLDYTPVGWAWKGTGYLGKKAGEMIGGEGSKSAEWGERLMNPIANAKGWSNDFDKYIKELPQYIREEIIPQIPSAVDTYAKMMKIILAFLALLETIATGEITTLAIEETYSKLNYKNKNYIPGSEKIDDVSKFLGDINKRNPKTDDIDELVAESRKYFRNKYKLNSYKLI